MSDTAAASPDLSAIQLPERRLVAAAVLGVSALVWFPVAFSARPFAGGAGVLIPFVLAMGAALSALPRAALRLARFDWPIALLLITGGCAVLVDTTTFGWDFWLIAPSIWCGRLFLVPDGRRLDALKRRARKKAGLPPLDPKAPPDPGAPVVSKTAENIEAMIVAVIIAFAIREFAIEAFKIPSQSMEPVLNGDALRGDRILINKLPYLFGGASRWEVAVFRYPLDQTKNFVKRIIGLPGEQVALRGGDVYVNGKIARKPLETQEQMWVPWYPEHFPAAQQVAAWFGPGATGTPVTGWSPSAMGAGSPVSFRASPAADGDDAPLWLWLNGIKDARPNSGTRDGREFVTDFRLRANVVLNGAALLMELRESATCFYRLRLDPLGESAVTIDLGDGAKSTQISTAVDRALGWNTAAGVPVSFEQSDDRVVLWINGAVAWSQEIDNPPPASPAPMAGFSAASAKPGSQVQVIAPAIDRDVHYLDPTPRNMLRQGAGSVTVPAGHYWALGDNSRESKDGRLWFAVEVTLKDGRVIRGDYDEGFETGGTGGFNSQPDADGVMWAWTGAHSEGRFAQLTDDSASFAIDLSGIPAGTRIGMHDVNGRVYRLLPSEIEKVEVRRALFVEARLMVGRAFCVVVPWENRRMIR